MGISVTQLAILLLIIIVLFGTKPIKNLGEDLGATVRNFRSFIKDKRDTW